MYVATQELHAAGGQYEAIADVLYPTSTTELSEIFRAAASRGKRLTLIGARRSFGEQFLPPPGAQGVSLERMGSPIQTLEREPDGNQWVRAPGSISFHELCSRMPELIPLHPPTGDRISIAGALAACTHDAVGFFAAGVRAFTLMTPQGQVYECRAGAPGLQGELFRLVPGSFGALGAILAIEIRLRATMPDERAEINVVENRKGNGDATLGQLEALYRRGDDTLGRGLFLYGKRRRSVLVNDGVKVLSPDESVKRLLLTDDATVRNILAQALANRFPRLVHRFQPLVLRKGRKFQAPVYGFSFYQRSYDRAYAYLASNRVLPKVLRKLGVDPRLTVCHQTFAIRVPAAREFLDLYFDTFEGYPDLERRLEQQDMIRLPECPYPLHASYGMSGGSYFFTCSFSVRHGRDEERRCREMLAWVSEDAWARLGVKVALLKQAHCSTVILRRMHAPFIEALIAMKSQVDPQNVLGSRMLDRLLGA